MAEGLLYQNTIRGNGWDGPGQNFPAEAVKLGRAKAKELKLEGPFHFMGQPHHEYNRDDAFDEAVGRLRKAKANDTPIVVMSSEYDQPAIAFRAIKDVADVAPWIEYAEKFESPCGRYSLGSVPGLPCPTFSDCSGLVMKSVGETKGIWLPHSAAQMWSDPRIDRFFQVDNVQSGDLIFYSFGRLGSAVDDVAMVYGDKRPGMQIGARPSVKPGYSTSGVQIWSMNAPGEASNRVGFGRLRAA